MARHTLKQRRFWKKHSQFERVAPKELIDLKETQFFPITTYTNKLTGFCLTILWDIITQNVFQLQTSTWKGAPLKKTAVKNTGKMCTKFNVTSILFSKYLRKHNFYHTSWSPKIQQLICYILINTVLTESVVIIKPESHSFNRAASRLSGARL